MPSYPPGGDEHLFLSYIIITWSGFFAAQLAYDWLKDARLHPVSVAATGWLVAVNAFALLLEARL